MDQVLRVAWIAGCATLGWYLFSSIPDEAWWGAVGGGVIGMILSPLGVTRLILMFVFACSATALAFHVLGISRDYTIFWFVGGAMLGRVIPIGAFSIKNFVGRISDFVERLRGA